MARDNVIQFTIHLKDNFTKGLKKARTGINRLGKVGIAGTAGFSAALLKTAQGIDAVAKNSDKLGIPTDALIGLQRAASLTGVQVRAMEMGIQRMTRRVAEAAQGTGEAKGALEELGISAKELGKLSPDQQFQRIAGAMGNVSTQGDRVRLAMRLFDSEGVALVNTLALGEDGLKRVQQETVALGLSFDRVDAAKVEMANDALFTAGQSIKGALTQATIELAPLIKAAAEEFVAMGKDAGGMGNLGVQAAESIIKGFAKVGDIFRGLQVTLKAAEAGWASFKLVVLAIFNTLLQGFLRFAGGLNELILRPIQKVLQFAGKFNDKAKEMAGSMESLINIPRVTWFEEQMENAGHAVVALNDELHNLAMQDLPSTGIEKFFAELKAKAQKAAEGIAKARAAATGGGATGETSPSKKEQEETEKVQQELNNRTQLIISSLAYQNEAVAQAWADRETEIQELRTAGQISEQLAQELSLRNQRNFQIAMGDEIARAEEEGIAFMQMSQDRRVKSILAGGAEQLSAVANTSKGLFNLSKAFSMATAMAELPSAIISTYKRHGGYPWGIIPAGIMAATGAAQIKQIKSAKFGGQAHDGLDFVPREGTFLLDRGERVLSPEQNQDLTNFLSTGGAGGGGGGMTIQVFPNVTNADSLLAMSAEEIREVVAAKIVPAMDELASSGVRPRFVERNFT